MTRPFSTAAQSTSARPGANPSFRATSVAPSGAAKRNSPRASLVNRSAIGMSAASAAAPASRISAPATGAPSPSTTRPVRGRAGARWISTPRTCWPARASSCTGLWPHSGAKGRNPDAVTAARSQRPSAGGTNRNAPSGSVRTEAAAPPREKVRSAPGTGPPSAVDTTRPSKLAGAVSGARSPAGGGSQMGRREGGAGRSGRVAAGAPAFAGLGGAGARPARVARRIATSAAARASAAAASHRR